MRILHCIRSVNPLGGGPIEGIKQLAAVNVAAGHEVEIVSLDSPNDSYIAGCGVTVYALGTTNIGYGYARRYVPWLQRHAKTYDAVIVNGIWQYSSFGVWRALHGSATPWFVFPHGMLDPWFKQRYPLKHLKKWLYWPWAEYRALRDARAVLFTCEDERLLARESFWLYRCRERVVNYGTAMPPGDPDRQRMAFLEQYPHLRDKRIVLFLGRLHEKKGPDLAIRAFFEAVRDPEAHLVLAGPAATPEYGSWLERMVDDPTRVTFTGMLSGDLKWGAYRTAECFILPSHQENFGIAVVEALACAVPVLISNKVNIWREILSSGVGFVESDTSEGTAKLLRRWFEVCKTEREAMRVKATDTFAERFEIHRAALSLLDTIRSLLDHPSHV